MTRVVVVKIPNGSVIKVCEDKDALGEWLDRVELSRADLNIVSAKVYESDG